GSSVQTKHMRRPPRRPPRQAGAPLTSGSSFRLSGSTPPVAAGLVRSACATTGATMLVVLAERHLTSVVQSAIAVREAEFTRAQRAVVPFCADAMAILQRAADDRSRVR